MIAEIKNWWVAVDHDGFTYLLDENPKLDGALLTHDSSLDYIYINPAIASQLNISKNQKKKVKLTIEVDE